MRLLDKLVDLPEYWNYEKNSVNIDEILLKDVNQKYGRLHHTTVHLYCYQCKGECERSLRTVLNNYYSTSNSWVLCEDCKKRARTSKSEILCLLISEYCFRNFGLVYDFQHTCEGLVSKEGYPLALDFAFFTSTETVSFILEIQGGLHSEKHFSESDQTFQTRIGRDLIKRDYCKEHRLKLIEMDYNSPNKKELRRIQSLFTQLLKEHELIPKNVDIPDFSEYTFHITLEYQKLNSNVITIKNLISYVIDGKRIGDSTNIDLIQGLYSSDKKYKTAYNRVVLPEVVYLLKQTDYSIQKISEITQVSETAIRRINAGESYNKHTKVSKEEPLRKMKLARIEEVTIWGIINDLKETKLTFREIGEKRNVSDSVPRAINDGSRYTEYSGASKEQHLRTPVHISKDQVLMIVKLLRTTDCTQKEIASFIGVTEAIVQKINTGHNYSKITDASSREPIRKRKKK